MIHRGHNCSQEEIDFVLFSNPPLRLDYKNHEGDQ